MLHRLEAAHLHSELLPLGCIGNREFDRGVHHTDEVTCQGRQNQCVCAVS